ncbi:MAG: hypothetical protein WCB49_04070 [Gammaproteobacteria bacterium]
MNKPHEKDAKGKFEKGDEPAKNPMYGDSHAGRDHPSKSHMDPAKSGSPKTAKSPERRS